MTLLNVSAKPIEFDFSSYIPVQVVQQMPEPLMLSMGVTSGDYTVIQAAKASIGQNLNNIKEIPEDLTLQKITGMINFLMSKRHGTPFEHSAMTFCVDAPIFMWREHHRHRIGWSYNEESGRYSILRPKFWIPSADRPALPVEDPGDKCTVQTIQPGSPRMRDCEGQLVKISNGLKECVRCNYRCSYHHSARPCFKPMPSTLWHDIVELKKLSCASAYRSYDTMIELGVAREVARSVLPVSIYSRCYTTCNPRSLMHFLSLRVYDADASFVSYPQLEIQNVASQYESFFAKHWPITYAAFNKNGRVAP